MMADWHVARAGQTLGAWPERDMRTYYAQGRVAPQDLVWREGMAEWQRACDVFGVAPPPRLHWAWVLVLSIVTLGVFFVVWAFVQAVWVKRRIAPASNAVTLLVVYVMLAMFGEFIADTGGKDLVQTGAGALISLAGMVALIAASFSIRRSLLDHFNRVEPIGLRMSRLWTFLFNALYIQHCFTRIAKRRMR